jgi:putative drug exporter of the RND superfamily
VTERVESVNGVEAVSPPIAEGPPGTLIQATLEPNPFSTAAFDLVEPMRDEAHGAAADVLIGGPTAVEFDVREAAGWDSTVIPPLILLVVFLILMGLLRAVIAPLVLIGTVILSFLAALGVGYFVFDVIFDFPGSDPSLPLFAFVFLVALGVDYNIFLIARAREETERHGSEQGILRALAVTGGVISSAGIVLAGTFSVLAILPLTFLTELGFVVAFGRPAGHLPRPQHPRAGDRPHARRPVLVAVCPLPLPPGRSGQEMGRRSAGARRVTLRTAAGSRAGQTS